MSLVTVSVKVTGRVQGVGYRYFCFVEAHARGIVGWVKNVADGSVEIEAEGEEQAIDLYIGRLKTGPRNAVVSEVAVSYISSTAKHTRFEIRH